MEYFVYIVRCRDNSLYTGITNDIERRLRMHNDGSGAKYTKGRRPVTLVYSTVCTNKSEALKKELEIKALSRARKEELCRFQV